MGKNERTEGQKSFHTVGGSADYANVQQHIVLISAPCYTKTMTVQGPDTCWN